MPDVAFEHILRLSAPASAPVPLRTGIPFPVGTFSPDHSVVMSTDSSQVECQSRPLMLWPDGSVQWALVDWMALPGINAYVVGLSSSRPEEVLNPANPQQSSLLLKQNKIRLGDVAAELDVRLGSNRELRLQITKREPIDDGPIRYSERLSGALLDDEGREQLHCILHVHSFHGTPLQRWSLTLRNPRAAVHPGGIWHLGDPNSRSIQSAEIRLSHPITAEKAFGGWARTADDSQHNWSSFDSKWSVTQLGSGGENYRSKVHRNAVNEISVPFRGYKSFLDEVETEGHRANPAVVIGCEASLGFYNERFWQNYPHRLSVEDQTIRFELFPHMSEAASDPRFDGNHELQPGEQKTYEFWVASGRQETAKRVLDQIRDMPHLALDPQSVAETDVIPHLTPESQDTNHDYVGLVHQAVVGPDSFFAKREQIDMYGWRNFGEVYGDHEAVNSPPLDPLISHYNNQYDNVLGLGIHCLRGGHGEFFELMKDLARHVIDIDTYHTDEDRPAYNQGQFWHTVHYVDAGLATHRAYPQGTCGGGPSSGQAYSRGLLLYYCLTGDESAKEVVVNMGEWMIAAEDGSKTKYRYFAGGETGLTSASGTEFYHGPGRGPANAVEVLVAAFELTKNRQYLSQAEHLIRRVVHPDQSVDELNLFDIENRWFYTMFLQALGRYLDLKVLLNELDYMYSYAQRVLLRFADWMVEHEYPYLNKPERLEYPNETWSAQEMRKCEALQWAAKHAESDSQKRYLDKAKEFFEVACEQLSSTDRSSLCRPVVLLLTNGYSRSWFQQRAQNLLRLPQGVTRTFSPHKKFVDQKQKAIQRAKPLVAMGMGTVVVVLALIAYWTRLFA